MKKTTRIICITLCVLLIALSAAGVIYALYSKFSNNQAYAEETEETIVNFNQFSKYYEYQISSSNVNVYYVLDNTNYLPNTLQSSHVYYYDFTINSSSNFHSIEIYSSGYNRIMTSAANNGKGNGTFTGASDIMAQGRAYILSGNSISVNFNLILIDLTLMYGDTIANTLTLEELEQIFTAQYYSYTTGMTIDSTGFEQYNAGVMSARESMTITTTSANIAENLDNVVINSSYGSTSKSLIQGYMVWSAQSNYSNCTALFNLETNFNEGDYFEFEFYTITGADSLTLPNFNQFYDLQIVAIDSNNNIVPLANVKAQDSNSITTKAAFYLPFSTDKLYITTPHNYIVGYNNFTIKITTTNLTALSLYSYKDGYRQGNSSGYNKGYNKGISEQNATLGTMEYIGAAFTGIGSILQIELLPGIPFSLFILLPLMFGLIAFVVKLSKGGS